MGMFDTVKFEAPCINCGATLKNFQSKDGDCELQTLSVKELLAQADGDAVEFYDYCDKCRYFNRYTANEDLAFNLKRRSEV